MNPAGLFVNTVTVKTPTETVGTDGSYVRTFTLDSGVKCSLQPLSASESIQYGRDAASVFARAYFSIGQVENLITVDSEILDADNVTWRVVGRPRNVGGRGVFLTVDLERQV